MIIRWLQADHKKLCEFPLRSSTFASGWTDHWTRLLVPTLQNFFSSSLTKRPNKLRHWFQPSLIRPEPARVEDHQASGLTYKYYTILELPVLEEKKFCNLDTRMAENIVNILRYNKRLADKTNRSWLCLVYMNSGASDFCLVWLILTGCLSDFWDRNFPISLSDFVQCDVRQSDAYKNRPDSKTRTNFGCFVWTRLYWYLVLVTDKYLYDVQIGGC
jgi:hypothetical protein